MTTPAIPEMILAGSDMADFGAMNMVWEDWIDGVNAPTRAAGEVRLATPDYRVEVIVTAALP